MSSEDDESSYASDVSVDGRHIGGIVDSPLHFDGLSTATGTSTLSAPRNTDHPRTPVESATGGTPLQESGVPLNFKTAAGDVNEYIDYTLETILPCFFFTKPEVRLSQNIVKRGCSGWGSAVPAIVEAVERAERFSFFRLSLAVFHLTEIRLPRRRIDRASLACSPSKPVHCIRVSVVEVVSFLSFLDSKGDICTLGDRMNDVVETAFVSVANRKRISGKQLVTCIGTSNGMAFSFSADRSITVGEWKKYIQPNLVWWHTLETLIGHDATSDECSLYDFLLEYCGLIDSIILAQSVRGTRAALRYVNVLRSGRHLDMTRRSVSQRMAIRQRSAVAFDMVRTFNQKNGVCISHTIDTPHGDTDTVGEECTPSQDVKGYDIGNEADLGPDSERGEQLRYSSQRSEARYHISPFCDDDEDVPPPRTLRRLKRGIRIVPYSPNPQKRQRGGGAESIKSRSCETSLAWDSAAFDYRRCCGEGGDSFQRS